MWLIVLEYYTSSHAAVVEGNSLDANSPLEISYQKLEPSPPGCWAKEGDMVTGEKRCFWSGGVCRAQRWSGSFRLQGELQAGTMPFSILFIMPHTSLSHVYKYYKAIYLGLLEV